MFPTPDLDIFVEHFALEVGRVRLLAVDGSWSLLAAAVFGFAETVSHVELLRYMETPGLRCLARSRRVVESVGEWLVNDLDRRTKHGSSHSALSLTVVKQVQTVALEWVETGGIER